MISTLLARLRAAGGDTEDIEVKASAGGLSPSLTGSLCALSNLPTGGWVILGLDERNDFAPVLLPDLNALKQGLASKARACSPPVQISLEDVIVGGYGVVVAKVAPTAVSARPCRVRATRAAWMRSWDGDLVMSSLEEQAFLAQRGHADFDQRPVSEARRADLDPELVELWSRTATEMDPQGLGRFAGEELLFRAGVVTADGTPTRGGLLVLGIHPQQFYPRFVINMSAEFEGSAVEVRAAETTTATGPIPILLDSALEWA